MADGPVRKRNADSSCSMRFATEKSSYSVAEFYNLFQHKLPLIVMVTQGFHGDIVEDVFDREQVMVLCAISRQSRVVGIFAIGSQSNLMSIPVEYPENLCTIKRGIVAKQDQLYKILQNNPLPIRIQFPEDRVLTVGNRSMSTNHIPPIELTKRFDEVYLLGNTIVDAELHEEVIQVPLYLSELRLSIVTGIIGQSFERWRKFVDHIKRKCSSIEYDMHFGNPNIAEYDPNAIHTDTKISYVQPKSYSSIISIIQGHPLKQRPNLQLPKRECYRTPNRAEQKNRQSRPLPPLPTEQNQQLYKKATRTSDRTQSSASMYITPISPPKSDFAGHEIPTIRRRHSPIPDYDQEGALPKQRPPVKENRQFAPEQIQVVPERQPISVQDVARQHNIDYPRYINNLPRSSVPPTIRSPHQLSQDTLLATPSDQENRVNVINSKSKEVINAEKLSIDEVDKYLRILKLDQYSKKFRDNMIDGTMLVSLTGSMLRDDLGMTGVEALRLLKFAKEGYIPA